MGELHCSFISSWSSNMTNFHWNFSHACMLDNTRCNMILHCRCEVLKMFRKRNTMNFTRKHSMNSWIQLHIPTSQQRYDASSFLLLSPNLIWTDHSFTWHLVWSNNIQGEVEFRSVLYIPGMAPMNNEDVINPKTKNIRLYVKRVFISDDFDGELVSSPTFIFCLETLN